jgi:OOP family OmpA-OmpF porin
MRLSSILIVLTTFIFAAALSLVVAGFSVTLIENASRSGVQHELDKRGMHWAEVYAEGLQVFVTGVAPSEAERFTALSTAGHIVDAARVIDNMEVESIAGLAPPRFSIEILRNDGGVSLIGLIPESSDRAVIVEELHDLAGEDNVTDLLEAAKYAAPDGWEMALNYSLSALEMLPRSKISVAAGRVTITAMSDSPKDRDRLQKKLTAKAPADLQLSLAISAPRPVITPFILRLVINEEGTSFDTCSADTEEAKARILKAAVAAGADKNTKCIIGLGVPSPTWAKAVEVAIGHLRELGGGSITFSDADVSLVALEGTSQEVFDREAGELEADLPDVFSLHSVLPTVAEAGDDGLPELTATLDPEGLLQIRGRLTSELQRTTVETYARARFGSDSVYMAARVDGAMPAQWAIRVLAGLDALSLVHHGELIVEQDLVSVSGKTGEQDASARIASVLSQKLSQSAQFTIDVTYVEELDPLAQIPTPEECQADIAAILSERKITFEPGSGTLDAGAKDVLDDIAEILRACSDVRLEIQGHTDSQGREQMNQQLSQSRAQAVLNGLQDRRLLTSSLSAKGYGEASPIADNETEEGREANRRIAFELVVAQEVDPAETPLENSTQSGEEGAATSEGVTQEAETDDQN